MNKYAVHLYTQVHIKITGIPAENMEQAIKATEGLDLHDLLDNKSCKYHHGSAVVEYVEWAENAPDLFLVDPLLENGEVDYDKTSWFGPDGLPLVDGNTTIEQKAKNVDLAAQFMQELLDSVETLTGVADKHGARTLADLMYLQLSIMKGSFIDHYPDESKVLDIARSLPSGELWVKFIEVEHMDKLQVFDGQAIAEATSQTGEQCTTLSA